MSPIILLCFEPNQIATTQFIESTVNRLQTNLGFNSLKDYDRLFSDDAFPPPGQGASSVTDDTVFAQEQLTFLGPLITRINKLPMQMNGKFDTESVRSLIPDWYTMEQALEKGLVYCTDLAFMDMHEVTHHNTI